MRLRNLWYYTREAGLGVWRNGWMTFASIIIVVLTLLILGSFVVINLNIHQITEEIKNQLEVVAYLEEELEDEQIEEIRGKILGITGVQQVEFVDKETALERLREQLGDQAAITEALEQRNPLPASFEIKATQPDRIPAIAKSLQLIAGIERVDYGQEVVDKLFQVTRIIQLFGTGIIVVLGIMALFLIANTIKLTVFARRKQIGIMKYVGATDWFIRWPFIMEGVFLGLLGAAVSFGVLFFVYNHFYLQASTWLYQNFMLMTLVSPEIIGLELLKILFALGIGIGGLGSGFSVRKFLKV